MPNNIDGPMRPMIEVPLAEWVRPGGYPRNERRAESGLFVNSATGRLGWPEGPEGEAFAADLAECFSEIAYAREEQKARAERLRRPSVLARLGIAKLFPAFMRGFVGIGVGDGDKNEEGGNIPGDDGEKNVIEAEGEVAGRGLGISPLQQAEPAPNDRGGVLMEVEHLPSNVWKS